MPFHRFWRGHKCSHVNTINEHLNDPLNHQNYQLVVLYYIYIYIYVLYINHILYFHDIMESFMKSINLLKAICSTYQKGDFVKRLTLNK